MTRLCFVGLFGMMLLSGCETPLVEGKAVGNLCPDIEGDDVDGKTIKLSDYRGKVVLVDFWGTWCGPCQRLIPHEAHKVQQDYKDRPFVILGIAMDNPATLKEFLAVKPLPWANIVDEKRILGKMWSVDYVPSFLVVDHTGVIRGRWFEGVTRDATEVWTVVDQWVQHAEKK